MQRMPEPCAMEKVLDLPLYIRRNVAIAIPPLLQRRERRNTNPRRLVRFLALLPRRLKWPILFLGLLMYMPGGGARAARWAGLRNRATFQLTPPSRLIKLAMTIANSAGSTGLATCI